MGIDQSNLAKVLGNPNAPSIRTLTDMAQALRCSVADLWPPADFSEGEAPYKAWRDFRRGTDLGRFMSADEIDDLSKVRFGHREPTIEFYQALLLAYRSSARHLPAPLRTTVPTRRRASSSSAPSMM